jgi:adenylate cyclase
LSDEQRIERSDASAAADELDFRKEIEEFYLPKQLVEAIYDLGEIPKRSIITHVGIGFIDIADYTYISKFLSPNENQAVLNGLYTALNWVIRRHGGYLNKIEGDSLMFHFGGLTDKEATRLQEHESEEAAVNYIARELFYTCVEMQRVVSLFNQANDKFIFEEVDASTKEVLQNAFDIIGTMRNSLEMSAAFNALFQIRVRIGANIGEVTLGNFGPDGAKQWDVIGTPVIDAKRMESTAPIGGLRISEYLFNVLDKAGIVDGYLERFKREAQAMFSTFRSISRDDLFKYSTVKLADKRNVTFNTYSVQVSPGLPEAIAGQIALLVDKGEDGADRVLDFLQYYRGNKFVVGAVEDVLREKGIVLRKESILRIISPKSFADPPDGEGEKLPGYYSLFDLLSLLGEFQDKINALSPHNAPELEFSDYDQYMDQQAKRLKRTFLLKRKATEKRLFFYDVIFPLVIRSIRTSIIEHQRSADDSD